MKLYRTIQELLGELDKLNCHAGLFVDPSSWETKPRETEILYLEGDDELEDLVPGTHLPKIADDRGMRELLEVETFRDVVKFERKRNPAASEADVIHALDYYLEKDDFCNPRQ